MKKNRSFAKTVSPRFLQKVFGIVSMALLGATLASNAGQGPQPSICVRSCWGARAASCSSMSSLSRAIIHHTAGAGDYSTVHDPAKVRAIQNYHMDTRGYCDIAYHFLCNAGGYIYEGRVGSMAGLTRGAHDGCNNNSFGFNVMGYYHPPYNQNFTSAARSSLEAVIAWRMPSSWSAYGSGTYCSANVGTLDGHYKVLATACPGDIIIPQIPGIRDGVEARKNGSGGAAGPTPAVVANSDGRQEIFAINLGGGTDHSWQAAANGGWSGWAGIGGWSSKIIAARNQNGTLEVFALGTSAVVYHSWGPSWSGFFSMGGTIIDIDVGMTTDGRLELFGVGFDGKLYHNWQLAPNGATGWSGWYLIGGSGLNRVMVAKNQNGSLEAFTIGYNTLYHSWNGPNGWVAPIAFPGSFIRDWSDMGHFLWDDGRLEVFCAATGGDVVHMWQLAPNGSTGWSGWASLGGSGITKVTVGKNENGRPELFVISGNTPQHNWWTGSTWSGFFSFGGWVRSLTVGRNLDGRQEIFGVGSDNQMYHNWQTAPNGGWSGWYGMGGSFK